jgi:hypothetical protein
VKNLTAAEVAAKWNTRAGAATTDWATGVQNTTVNPGQAAAANVAGFQQNFIAAIPKWQAAMGTMDLGAWKTATVAKGQPRYAQGVTAGQAKYQAKIAKILAVEKQIVGSLPPRGNRSQNIQRSVSFQESMGAAADSGQFS